MGLLQQIATSLICDNEGLVECISRYSDTNMSHVTPDITKAYIILPRLHFSKRLEYYLEWHRGHVERRKDDRQQWTSQETANVVVDELAGQAWDEEYSSVKPHLVAPHY